MDWRVVEPGPLPEPSRGPCKEPLVTLRVSVAIEVTANDVWPDNRRGYPDKSDSIWLPVQLMLLLRSLKMKL